MATHRGLLAALALAGGCTRAWTVADFGGVPNPILLGPKKTVGPAPAPMKETVLDEWFRAVSVDFSETDVGQRYSSSAVYGNYIVTTTWTTPSYHMHAKTDNAYLADRISKGTGDDPGADFRIDELLTNTEVLCLHASESTRVEVIGKIVKLEGK